MQISNPSLTIYLKIILATWNCNSACVVIQVTIYEKFYFWTLDYMLLVYLFLRHYDAELITTTFVVSLEIW